MQLDTVMHNLWAQLRLEPASPDARGRYALLLDGVHVNFCPVEGAEAMLVRSRLGTIDPLDSELLRELMADNVLLPLGRGVLSLDENEAAFLSARFELADLAVPELLRSLAGFLQRAKGWQQHLASRESAGLALAGAAA
ncbi:CesT family type III secretion system chaperone [Ramlibacter sp. AN1015]|uniref:CesT family type III secretion system chaperone n=1 Tax=Ramlibacter sp. AN1015 TaxID=3133428 RepID=UPI0030BC33F6